VEEETLMAFDPDLSCFANVNRPEDLTMAADQVRLKWPRKSI